MTTRRTPVRSFGFTFAAVAAGLLAGSVLSGPGAFGPAEARAAVASASDRDKLLMRSGNIVEGELIEETETTVTFNVMVGSISARQVFQKADILKIERADAPAADEAPEAAPVSAAKTEAVRPADPNAKVVFVIPLKGRFGEDITQTPLRKALAKAREMEADYVIIELENDWSVFGGLVNLPDDVAAANELQRAEQITPIFTSEIPREWKKPPVVVFWVKQGMGGASLLPLVCKNIYFSSTGRLGGIGNLSRMLGSTGDEVVRQKLYSAFMAHAEGWAVAGGYDYRIVRAMARPEYVLSYRLEGGRPVLLERMPEGSGEFLLTDDGEEDREDTIQELAAGEGNDVLTLNAELARKLQVSKGTADSLSDLLYALNISRVATVVDKPGKQVMESWSRGLDDAQQRLRRLLREFAEIQVEAPGDYQARTRARGARRAKLEEMRRIYAIYGEGITQQWLAQNQFPGQIIMNFDGGVRDIIEQIKMEQLADKR